MPEKKVMIQTVMSVEEFALCQQLFKELMSVSTKGVDDTGFYQLQFYFKQDDLKSIENLRSLFLPDIKIL